MRILTKCETGRNSTFLAVAFVVTTSSTILDKPQTPSLNRSYSPRAGWSGRSDVRSARDTMFLPLTIIQRQSLSVFCEMEY